MRFYFENEYLKPYKKHRSDAGWDLKTKEEFTIMPKSIHKVTTGVSCEIPRGCVGLIKERSSIGACGLHTVAGVIDSDYRGEISIVLHNTTDNPVTIFKHERIAQIIIVPVLLGCEMLKGHAPQNTERGDGGFGSTNNSYI